MTTRKLTWLVIAFALVVGTFVADSTVKAQKQTQWEYMIQGKRELDRKEGEALQSEFNNIGAGGWEYVGMMPGKDDAFSVVFKRRK